MSQNAISHLYFVSRHRPLIVAIVKTLDLKLKMFRNQHDKCSDLFVLMFLYRLLLTIAHALISYSCVKIVYEFIVTESSSQATIVLDIYSYTPFTFLFSRGGDNVRYMHVI